MSLTDLWKAAGSPKRKDPNRWTRLKGSDEWIEHIAANYKQASDKVLVTKYGGSTKRSRYPDLGNDTSRRKRGWYESIGANGDGESTKRARVSESDAQGTWAHWEIAVAYARWISPEFHRIANRAFREWAEEKANPELKIERGYKDLDTRAKEQNWSPAKKKARAEGLEVRIPWKEALSECAGQMARRNST